MVSEQPAFFQSLPQSAFPFEVFAYPESQREDVNPVWHQRVEGPGALQVPSLRSALGERVRIVVRFATGEVHR